MADQITVTAKIGEAVQATTTVITDLLSVNFDVKSQVLRITKLNGVVIDYDLNGIATVTYTVASHVATIAVS